MLPIIEQDELSYPAVEANDLFVAVMALQRRQFTTGWLDAAYHSLAAALHLADSAGNVSNLLRVAAMAEEQLGWINANAPEYFHSSVSTEARGNRTGSIWEALSKMAERRALLFPTDARFRYIDVEPASTSKK